MDFIERIQELSARVPKVAEMLLTEEATKNALVMPFIAALGYDVFNPTEVIPEFICDFGTKKGEKVDYALRKEEKIIILFECKTYGTNLDNVHASQLYRYFSVTDARIGVLTNGVEYRFFTDLEAPNKMDEKPFLVFHLNDIQEPIVAEIKKLSKPSFALDEVLTSAGELKYTREIKRILTEQLNSPSDEFVRFFASKLHDGPLTPKVREKFTEITRRGFHQFINDRLSERLKSAMAGTSVSITEDAPPAAEEPAAAIATDNKERVTTTEEEREGYYIVKAILRQEVDPNRIIARDTQSYFGILLDDNNRKPLARLYFNTSNKYLGVFNEDRQETRVLIENLNQIYEHADTIKKVLSFYEKNRNAE